MLLAEMKYASSLLSVTLFLFLFAYSSSRISAVVSGNRSQGETYLADLTSDLEYQGNSVWICDGKKAYAYHSNRKCSGLNSCKGKILNISKDKAVD